MFSLIENSDVPDAVNDSVNIQVFEITSSQDPLPKISHGGEVRLLGHSAGTSGRYIIPTRIMHGGTTE